MQFRTTVELPEYPFKLSHRDKLCFVGSCFAENIGQRFAQRKFNTLINPFGVLYNPLSVNHCLLSVLHHTFDENQLIFHNGLWHSLAHHGSFSHTDKRHCLSGIKENLSHAQEHLLTSDYLLLTLGTAHVFEYNEKPVANCHKLPSRHFTSRRLDTEEIVSHLTESIKQLRHINPQLNIIFTVSPVRYPQNGMNANSLSKATLLLAVEQLCQMDKTYYLPAYEILMDELRDYRFYADDMKHPSILAIDYIWKKMRHKLFSSATQQLCKTLEKLHAACAHRPFNTNPEAHEEFLSAMQQKALNLQAAHPDLDLQEELAYFSK